LLRFTHLTPLPWLPHKVFACAAYDGGTFKSGYRAEHADSMRDIKFSFKRTHEYQKSAPQYPNIPDGLAWFFVLLEISVGEIAALP